MILAKNKNDALRADYRGEGKVFYVELETKYEKNKKTSMKKS